MIKKSQDWTLKYFIVLHYFHFQCMYTNVNIEVWKATEEEPRSVWDALVVIWSDIKVILDDTAVHIGIGFPVID